MNYISVITARKDKNVRRYKSDKERLETEVEELEKKVERMGRSGTQVNKAAMLSFCWTKETVIVFKLLNKARGGLFMISWHASCAKDESFHLAAFFAMFKLLLAYWIILWLGKCMDFYVLVQVSKMYTYVRTVLYIFLFGHDLL